VIFAGSSMLRYDSSDFFSVLPCSCDLKTENRFINA